MVDGELLMAFNAWFANTGS